MNDRPLHDDLPDDEGGFDLETEIRESLRADVSPGIPTPIEFGLLPRPVERQESPEVQQQQQEPGSFADHDDDIAFVERAEPEMLPHEHAHPFAEVIRSGQPDAVSAPELPEHAAEDSFDRWPGQEGQMPAELPDMILPRNEQRSADQQDQGYSFRPPVTKPGDEIPFPEFVSPHDQLDSPFVFPFGGAASGSSGGRMEMSVNVEMPDQREMMDEMRDRLAPMFDRVQEQLVQATEDAFDIERELMDRRNVY